MPEAWYNLSVEDTLNKLGSSASGLSNEEARRRLERYGPNELVRTRRKSPIVMFLGQFNNLLIIILVIAAVIAAALDEWIDASVILIIVILNAVLGFVQENRAEKALEALKVLAAPKCRALRNREPHTIETKDLVPGDVVLLAAGDKVPADLRLMDTAGLRVNEAPLTGESVPIAKTTEPVRGEVFLGDQRDMCFLGCTVEAGRGTGVVTSTGMATQLGKIAGLVQAEPATQTPMQKQLAKLARQLGVAILALVIMIFVIEYIRLGTASDIVELFLTSVSLAVAAIPEGLPAVVTISLALGLQRMAKRNALIRRLAAAETLGSASVICTDKTGTLTRGEMNVVMIYSGGVDYRVEGEGFSPEGRVTREGKTADISGVRELEFLLKAGLLCNDASLGKTEKAWTVTGDTTEGALLVAGMRAGLSKEVLESDSPRVAEIAFTSERKMMSTVHIRRDLAVERGLDALPEAERLSRLKEIPGKTVFVKGAPERVVRACEFIMKNGKAGLLNNTEMHELTYRNQEMAAKGLRVLGIAYRELPDHFPDFSEKELESKLTFLGFVGMMDTPRKDAVDALKECQRAGITVVMITGDHKLTAMAVAADMGILTKGQKALTGEELGKLTDEQLHETVEDVRVYARVSPEDKMRILKAWKKRGRIVVMTGDGVNDAPALRSSDLGVAMGVTGTDVAKESADMVLTDDSFASIVGAVEEGRGIYQNIRKFVRYLLSTNSGEVMTIFAAALLFMPLPLVPLQILWINLITDGLPAVALGVEPKEKGLMRQKPRDPKAGILSGGIPFSIIWVGALMAIGSLAIFQWSLGFRDINEARTLVFYTLTMFQMFNVLAIRVERDSVFKAGFLANKFLIAAVLSTVALQLAVIYVPPLQVPFQTRALPWEELLLATLVASSMFFAVEFEKLIKRRLEARKTAGSA
jgi:Ca2+-transporting ATPase